MNSKEVFFFLFVILGMKKKKPEDISKKLDQNLAAPLNREKAFFIIIYQIKN